MNNVPLINNLTVNDINTALIAIKKNLVKGSNGNEQLQDVDVNVDVNIAQNCTYCAADSTTIKGAELFQGCSIKVLFTSAITGSNTTSPLTINYNNVDITVKVGKNGALANFIAYNTGSGYVYCQAYTTLELLFDGNNFVIMGNPVVISNSDYTVYTDGSITYSKNQIDNNCPQKYSTKNLNDMLLTQSGFKYLLDAAEPSAYTGLPEVSDFDIAGGGIGIELLQFSIDRRGLQILFLEYYNGIAWKTKIYSRKSIDTTIFSWQIIQDVYN